MGVVTNALGLLYKIFSCTERPGILHRHMSLHDSDNVIRERDRDIDNCFIIVPHILKTFLLRYELRFFCYGMLD